MTTSKRIVLPEIMDGAALKACQEYYLGVNSKGDTHMQRYIYQIFPFNNADDYQSNIRVYLYLMFKFIESIEVNAFDEISIEMPQPFPFTDIKTINRAMAHWPGIQWRVLECDQAKRQESLFCYMTLKLPDISDMSQPLWMPTDLEKEHPNLRFNDPGSVRRV